MSSRVCVLRGLVNTSATGPSSTTRPPLITDTVWEISATTARSWETNR
jgi:hypothetical protein